MDKKSQKTLEFDKVLDRVAAYAAFSAGEELVRTLTPTTDLAEARRRQQETAEAIHLLAGGSEVTIGGTRDVRPDVDRAERGITLLPDRVLAVRNTLVAARELRRKIDRVRERHPQLAEIADLIEDCPGLVSAVNNALDDRGEVLDTASPRLGEIRRSLRVVHGRIQDKLRSLINSKSSYLQEPLISMRNGRYVLPVRTESKGNVKGIVHDQSSSGATAWIEPMHTVELNNQYRSLQAEEEEEVQRILRELSQKVAQQGGPLVRIVERMAEFDLIFCRARYASDINGIAPEFEPWTARPDSRLHPGSRVWIRGARHPLLARDEVVPIDLTVPDDVFLVLITGPNTGGKTVSLKTMGLMTLMAQSGLHLPCKEAKLTLFDDVFADIGDEQSIEQSLSTFSGHMTNIIRVLDQADDRSLVLLDELGSGTDPAEGAALAQAIIDYLRDAGATMFTATHYPELKAYALRTEGATNASLLFDIDTLSPTYVMTIGVPGKSNALAIARRLGLDETVLDGAMQLLGVGTRETEDLLDSIYDMRERIATEEAAARLARKRAERAEGKLEDRLADIEIERRQVIKEARQQFEEELDTIRQEIKRVRKDLKSAESKNRLKKLNRAVDDIEDRPLSSVTPTPLLDEVLPKGKDKPGSRPPKKLEEGDDVFIKTLNSSGQVMKIYGNEAEVAVGRLHMRVKLDELEFKGRPVVAEEPESESISMPDIETPDMEIDLRGERVPDGLAELDKYLDSAVLSRLPWVRIIHGKGTGRLRQAVRDALDRHRAVASWEEGKRSEGGAGVTVAKLEDG